MLSWQHVTGVVASAVRMWDSRGCVKQCATCGGISKLGIDPCTMQEPIQVPTPSKPRSWKPPQPQEVQDRSGNSTPREQGLAGLRTEVECCRDCAELVSACGPLSSLAVQHPAMEL